MLTAAICSVLSTPRTLAEDDVATFPLPYFEELVVIPAVVNGKECLCVIDSGASTHFFHRNLENELEPPTVRKTFSDASENLVEIQQHPCPAITVGSLNLNREWPVGCADLSPARSASGRDLNGILGMPLFLHHIVQFNFDRREVRIMPSSAAPSKDWGEPIAVTASTTNTPVVLVTFGDHEEPCVVDTGFDGSLMLRSDAYAYLVKKGDITARGTASAADFFGIHQSRQGRLSHFELGEYSHQNLPVLEGEDESRIGLQYLRRYLVTFDLIRHRMFFAPGFDVNQPNEDLPFGIGLLRQGGKTIVVDLDDDGIAKRAGFRAGDELISVSGIETADKPIAEIKWMIKRLKERPTIDCVVRREGKLQSVILTRDLTTPSSSGSQEKAKSEP